MAPENRNPEYTSTLTAADAEHALTPEAVTVRRTGSDTTASGNSYEDVADSTSDAYPELDVDLRIEHPWLRRLIDAGGGRLADEPVVVEDLYFYLPYCSQVRLVEPDESPDVDRRCYFTKKSWEPLTVTQRLEVLRAFTELHWPEDLATLKSAGDRLLDVVSKVGLVEPRPGRIREIIETLLDVKKYGTPVEEEIDESRKWNEALAQALHDVQAALGVKGKRNLQPMFEPLSTLMTREIKSTPWVVQGLVTEGAVGQIAGEPKVAKSWACTEIAVAMATGTRAFGEFTTGAPKRVHYFYAEDMDRDVRAHIGALFRGRGLDVADFKGTMHVQPRGRFIDLLDDGDLALIIASVRFSGGTDLLCLDPLRDIHGGEEDSSDSMRDVMRRLRLLGEQLKCTVIFVHHMKKQGQGGRGRPGQQARGSSAIHGSTDAGIYITDLKGDGQQHFATTVTSEVKGARSAGRFELTLDIRDDSNGSSVDARWTVNRDGATSKEVDINKLDANTRHTWKALADKLAAEFEHNHHTAKPGSDETKFGTLGVNKLVQGIGGVKKLTPFIQGMVRAKLLFDTGRGYQLTELGKNFQRETRQPVTPPADNSAADNSGAGNSAAAFDALATELDL